MTTPSTARKAGPYSGTGAQTSFPFTFKVFAASDVKVVVADANGDETVLTLGAQYSVTLNSNQETSPGGTITYPISGSPLPVGGKLSIVGNLPYDQPLDLPSGGNFSPLALENQLDRATIQIQQLKEQVDRAAKVPVTYDAADLEEFTADIVRLADSADNIDTVAQNIATVDAVAADIAVVADNVADVTNFADVYYGPSATDPATRRDGSALQGGDLYFNTGAQRMRVYAGGMWTDGVVNTATTSVQRFSGDGSTVAFPLAADPVSENNTQVFIGGVYQQKDTYSVGGTALTLNVAPPAGTNNIEVVSTGTVAGFGTLPASAVTFKQAGTGAVDRTASEKLREFVSVKDFGAVGNGVTDDTSAIQAAITASKGKRLLFPAGRYLTSSTLTVPHPMILIGEGSALNDSDGTGAATILFSGTGPALQFGGAGYAIFYPNLQNLRIQATGAAITDANAIGLCLVNIHGGKFYDLAVRSFQAGTGVLCTATAGQISAGNTFWGPNLWQNFVGFKFDGAGAANPFAADYASYIFGGAVIGVDDGGLGIAGSRGLWVTQWAAETQVYATDFETFDVCIDLYGDHPNTGGGVKLIGTRTEFQRTRAIRVNANTIRTQIIGHRFAGGAASTWLQDNGLRTLRIDPDGNIRTNTADLELLNDIPVKLQDSGGTARTVMKMATNNTVQIGSVNYSGFNGNYGLGTWNFTAPVFENAGGASGWQNAVCFGAYRLWVDSTGKLRIKNSAPASDTDGTVVGTQT